MEPMTILALTGGVIGQIAVVVLRFRPAFVFVSRLVDCLQHPRPPPPLATTVEQVTEAIAGKQHPNQHQD
ncbi:hypothetical protein QJS10_CPB15g01023 [Acorus calamus]|uniref:Uncharacterized protein n=1 Tax=Acorus calamus TaxID=4465 RepID=A0AAV9D5Y6_ACOCL|nr:hypothetical protein QJS10_CPB15g01023 [Acorus calamus]